MLLPTTRASALPTPVVATASIVLRTFTTTGCHRRETVAPPAVSTSSSASSTASFSSSSSSSSSAATAHTAVSPLVPGPLREYDARVAAGRLHEDAYQRAMVQHLQALHDRLLAWDPPAATASESEVVREVDVDADVSGPGGGGSSSGVATADAGTTSGSRSVGGSAASFLGSLAGMFGFQSRQATARAAAAATAARTPRGIYMYGDVGCGKTMLMDLFFDSLPATATRTKRRLHYDRFIQGVHRRLHAARREAAATKGKSGGHGHHGDDALPAVAADLAAHARVLCLDEFQCTDVADAMILRRLLAQLLLGHGVVLVATSNRAPVELYKNGVQRQSFVPAIHLLERRNVVVDLDSPTDYRAEATVRRRPSGVYHARSDDADAPAAAAAAADHADRWFAFLGDFEHEPPAPTTLTVWGRAVPVPAASGRVARFEFGDIVGAATGAADFLALAQRFRAFIVTDVPAMDVMRDRDAARRFITFVDAVYDAGGALVLTSEVPLQRLFVVEDDGQALTAPSVGSARNAGKGKQDNGSVNDEERFALSRLLSRLAEMGTVEWVERAMRTE